MPGLPFWQYPKSVEAAPEAPTFGDTADEQLGFLAAGHVEGPESLVHSSVCSRG